jgi:hypothetical protein
LLFSHFRVASQVFNRKRERKSVIEYCRQHQKNRKI